MATALSTTGHTGHKELDQQAYATGAGAIDHTFTVPDGKLFRLVSITLKMSAAPTTSENAIVTLDSVQGAAYDTQIYKKDLAATSVTSEIITADDFGEFTLVPGDVLTVTYTNTDVGTWGLTVTVREA